MSYEAVLTLLVKCVSDILLRIEIANRRDKINHDELSVCLVFLLLLQMPSVWILFLVLL